VRTFLSCCCRRRCCCCFFTFFFFFFLLPPPPFFHCWSLSVSQAGRPSIAPFLLLALPGSGFSDPTVSIYYPFQLPPLPSCRFSFSSSARLALSRRLVQLPCLSVALESPAPRLGSHSAADPIDADVCPSSLDFTLPSLFFLANHTRGFQFQFQIECPAPISTTTFPPLSSSHTYLALPYLTLLTYLTYPPTHPAAGWLAY
jgi:hypothetical protein